MTTLNNDETTLLISTQYGNAVAKVLPGRYIFVDFGKTVAGFDNVGDFVVNRVAVKGSLRLKDYGQGFEAYRDSENRRNNDGEFYSHNALYIDRADGQWKKDVSSASQKKVREAIAAAVNHHAENYALINDYCDEQNAEQVQSDYAKLQSELAELEQQAKAKRAECMAFAVKHSL